MEIVETKIVYPKRKDENIEDRVLELRIDPDDPRLTDVVVRAESVKITVRTTNEFTGMEIVKFVLDEIDALEE